MKTLGIVLIVMAAALSTSTAQASECAPVGNLGYNSYEGYLTDGHGLNKQFGPGVGYPTENGDFFRRYYPADQWGRFGYGTGHAGEGYGPYIYGRREGPSPPGMFDELPGTFAGAPPPKIKVGGGNIKVSLPSDIPGITRVCVTTVAFNNACLDEKCSECAPWVFNMPVLDGVKTVRVRIEYVNKGLSATAYPL